MKITYTKMAMHCLDKAKEHDASLDDLSIKQMKSILGILFGYIIENVSCGNVISIMNFGSFHLKKWAGRVGWDMVRKQKVKRKDKFSIKFEPSPAANVFIHNKILEYVKSKESRGDSGGSESSGSD